MCEAKDRAHLIPLENVKSKKKGILLAVKCTKWCTIRIRRIAKEKQKQTSSGRFGQKRAKNGQKHAFLGKNMEKIGQKPGETGQKTGKKLNPGKTWQNRKFCRILVWDRPTLCTINSVKNSEMVTLN